MKFLFKYFLGNRKEKLFPNDSSFISNLINAKTNTIWQFKYNRFFRSSHQRCSVKKNVLRNFTKFTGKHLWLSLFFKAGPNVAHFSTKKESDWKNHIENDKNLKENLASFHDVKKQKFIFLMTYLFLILVNTEFFKNVYRDRISTVFHNIWMTFRTAKTKHSNSNF